eukprot:9114772-Pyramimonas_sp.AAC.1
MFCSCSYNAVTVAVPLLLNSRRAVREGVDGRVGREGNSEGGVVVALLDEAAPAFGVHIKRSSLNLSGSSSNPYSFEVVLVRINP